ncbi:MAG: hypothetical protein SPF17_03780 [Candidatus Mucispirillum faecigallinarum]|nr:hypothetical protein [Candidatus Mucispirillum faecigallinarum]
MVSETLTLISAKASGLLAALTVITAFPSLFAETKPVLSTSATFVLFEENIKVFKLSSISSGLATASI